MQTMHDAEHPCLIQHLHVYTVQIPHSEMQKKLMKSNNKYQITVLRDKTYLFPESMLYSLPPHQELQLTTDSTVPQKLGNVWTDSCWTVTLGGYAGIQ